jgi:cell wall-associated NlpC family hydrolase
VARFNLARAQKTLSQRMVSIYTAGEEQSTLAVLLGSTSIDDMMNRIETVSTITSQDSQVIGEVTSFRSEIQQRQQRLQTARAEQAQAVASRAAERARIRGTLQQRQSLLGSIRGEISHIRAAEQARQLMMARQAQARVSATPDPILSDPGLGTPAAASTPAPSLAPPSQYGGVVGIAMRYLGVPYVWGGSSPSGFDCSGFTAYVYGQVGVSLPHYTGAQYGMGVAVSRDELQPGDLVFFNGLGHEGLYIGGGQFIHAPHTGDVVKISSLSDSWYASTYVGARRITG